MNLKKRGGLCPAKNNEDIGIADEKEKKFYKLNQAYLDIWALCDGSLSEEEIATKYIDFLISNSKSKKIDQKKLRTEISQIIKKLRKFNLIE